MKQNWQQAGQKVKPGLKIAGKLVLMTALRYGPAGVAGWAIPQAGQNDAGGRSGAAVTEAGKTRFPALPVTLVPPA